MTLKHGCSTRPLDGDFSCFLHLALAAPKGLIQEENDRIKVRIVEDSKWPFEEEHDTMKVHLLSFRPSSIHAETPETAIFLIGFVFCLFVCLFKGKTGKYIYDDKFVTLNFRSWAPDLILKMSKEYMTRQNHNPYSPCIFPLKQWKLAGVLTTALECQWGREVWTPRVLYILHWGWEDRQVSPYIPIIDLVTITSTEYRALGWKVTHSTFNL